MSLGDDLFPGGRECPGKAARHVSKRIMPELSPLEPETDNSNRRHSSREGRCRLPSSLRGEGDRALVGLMERMGEAAGYIDMRCMAKAFSWDSGDRGRGGSEQPAVVEIGVPFEVVSQGATRAVDVELLLDPVPRQIRWR